MDLGSTEDRAVLQKDGEEHNHTQLPAGGWNRRQKSLEQETPRVLLN